MVLIVRTEDIDPKDWLTKTGKHQRQSRQASSGLFSVNGGDRELEKGQPGPCPEGGGYILGGLLLGFTPQPHHKDFEINEKSIVAPDGFLPGDVVGARAGQVEKSPSGWGTEGQTDAHILSVSISGRRSNRIGSELSDERSRRGHPLEGEAGDQEGRNPIVRRVCQRANRFAVNGTSWLKIGEGILNRDL